MSWYKITFPYKDCGVGGKRQELQDAFATLLIANGGLPRGAAMFSQEAEDFEAVVYYFSPAAMTIARLLIESYGAVQCPAPPRGAMRLAAGDARAFEILWPEAGKRS